MGFFSLVAFASLGFVTSAAAGALAGGVASFGLADFAMSLAGAVVDAALVATATDFTAGLGTLFVAAIRFFAGVAGVVFFAAVLPGVDAAEVGSVLAMG